MPENYVAITGTGEKRNVGKYFTGLVKVVYDDKAELEVKDGGIYKEVDNVSELSNVSKKDRYIDIDGNKFYVRVKQPTFQAPIAPGFIDKIRDQFKDKDGVDRFNKFIEDNRIGNETDIGL